MNKKKISPERAAQRMAERAAELADRKPPHDLPPHDFAVIRSEGAVRRWQGRVWRWDGREWELIKEQW